MHIHQNNICTCICKWFNRCSPQFLKMSRQLDGSQDFKPLIFLKFVFGVCDASQLAEWIEALTALKEPDALGEDIPVWAKKCGCDFGDEAVDTEMARISVGLM